MTRNIDRRTALQRIAAGTCSLAFAGPVTATENTRYVVTARGGGVEKRIEAAGFDVERALASGSVLLVDGPSSERSALRAVSGVTEVARDFKLERVEPNPQSGGDARSTDEALFDRQWDKQSLTTDVPRAHDIATGDGARIAVVDTGVRFDHPDLASNTDRSDAWLVREGEIRAGSHPVELPRDFSDMTKGTKRVTQNVGVDVRGHGTHVTGIAAADRSGTTGVVGTAPDADVATLRVLYWEENGDGRAVFTSTIGDILTGIDLAADIGADVMNLSLGIGPEPPQSNRTGLRVAFKRVVRAATNRGTAVVASAGNEGASVQNGTFHLPSDVPGAMNISATGPNDRRAWYSNYGTNEITVGAPGGGYETRAKQFSTTPERDADRVDDPDEPGVEWPFPTNWVLSTGDPDTWFANYFDVPTIEVDGGSYMYLRGTSMAAPQVAGAVALLREAAPEANINRIQKAIEHGAETVPGEGSPDLGAGRLNCYNALNAPIID